jgi:phage terminase small subunit
MTDKLTAKQAAFVAEYLVDFNSAAAARRAGYSVKTAQAIGVENLRKPLVQQAIQAAMLARQERVEITQDMVVRELAAMAFLDIRRLFDADGKPIKVFQLDAATARAIQGLDVVTVGNADVGFGEVTKLKFGDKRAALVDLGKHIGMWPQKAIDINMDTRGAASEAVAAMMATLFAPPRKVE